MKNFILGMIVATFAILAINYHNTHKTAEYSAYSDKAPLPALLQDWTDEQLEDEQITYKEAIETLKEEQQRRASR